MPYETITQQILDWARAREDIRAALVVGSLARAGTHPADAFSDLDLVLYTTDRALYQTADSLPHLAAILLHIREETWPDGSREYMALLIEDGVLGKIDLAFPPVERLALMVQGGLEPPYDRGYIALLDKDGLAAKLPAPGVAKPFLPLPGQAEFNHVVGEFFYDALMTAKQIRRGNLWLAKSKDCLCKHHLLTMLEWQTLADKPMTDVWHDGRFMQEWLDKGIQGKLPDLFGGFDAASSFDALKRTIELFRQSAQHVAARLKLDYPAIDEPVMAVILNM
jgi:aminoglycoside 6-adenylyltransferase